MSFILGLPRTRPVSSRAAIWTVSLASGLAVFGVAIFLQWIIYDDWMRDAGPFVGCLLAGALMCALVFGWQMAIRRSRLEMLRRFETIRWMNDRIRNSLQAIECVTYHANPEATDSVRSAVDSIESVLQEVLSSAHAPIAQAESDTESSLTMR
jgi:hypothetical protein